MVTPGGLEPPTFSLEGCCSIQLSYGALNPHGAAEIVGGAIRRKKSVRPGAAAIVSEIIRVGDRSAHFGLRFGELVSNAAALAVGDRLFLGVELQAQLLSHVARGGPAHQRLDGAPRLRLLFEHPEPGLRGS